MEKEKQGGRARRLLAGAKILRGGGCAVDEGRATFWLPSGVGNKATAELQSRFY